MCTPFFFLSLQSPHQKVPKNAKKNFRIFWTPPPEKKSFSGHAIIKISQTQEFSVFISQMMLNGPKNGLTYTQNDREKWRNTFTMIVSAILHVLVTEKVQQASTITLAPRCSHASDSPGPAMVEFLSNPFIPCNLRPKYLKTGGVYPPIRRAQCDRRGAPLASGEAPSQGVRPFAVAQGASHPAILGGWWGHVVPNPQKSYLRLVWHQYVVGGGCGCTPVPRKKKRRKRQNKVSNPLGPNFCKAHISKLVCAPPFFLLSLQSPHQKVPKNAKKNFRIFCTPLPEKKFFCRPCHHQNQPNSGVFCIHLINDAKRPKKRAHI